jgi:hypothetical protein
MKQRTARCSYRTSFPTAVKCGNSATQRELSVKTTPSRFKTLDRKLALFFFLPFFFLSLRLLFFSLQFDTHLKLFFFIEWKELLG